MTLLLVVLLVAAVSVGATLAGIVGAWTALSAFGCAVSLYLIVQAILDLLALRKARVGNGRRSLAWKRLGRELCRGGMVQLPFLVSGAIFWGEDVHFTWFVGLLMVANAGTLASSALDWSARYLLFETRDHEAPLPEPDVLP